MMKLLLLQNDLVVFPKGKMSPCLFKVYRQLLATRKNISYLEFQTLFSQIYFMYVSATPIRHISNYENCYGFIENIRFVQTDSPYIEDAVTVVKLHNEPLSHYTVVPQHRELLMDAFYFGYETQLLTNSCTDSDDRGFAAFRIIRSV